MNKSKYIKLLIFIVLASLFTGFLLYFIPPLLKNQIVYKNDETIFADELLNKKDKKDPSVLIKDEIITKASNIIVTHVETPAEVKAVYISSWVAGSPKFRDTIIDLVNDTELNAIVIDIKDSTGKVSFDMPVTEIQKIGSIENRISNIRALTDMLHKKNIYIIGRISVFQDPYMATHKPSLAITKLSDGKVWKDRKGLSFIDPTKKEFHDYIISLAKASYEEGFDEINFDYIRYPSDGNMKDINYHLQSGETRSDNMEKFFKYLSTEMKKDKNIIISADLFGLTTESSNDMGIGQVWEKTLPYFDYLAPMVYPSHYPAGHAGYKNPSQYPYEVINRALKGAILKTTTSGENIKKIRPWLQDFDMGAVYTKELVQAQIKAVYDNGLNSWMLWDPSNKYTKSALKLETKQ